jgi:hypothetical protein
MSGAGAPYLIVRRGAWDAALVKLDGAQGRRLIGRDLETGDEWTDGEAAVLGRHASLVAASSALARVRRRSAALKSEIDRAARAVRKQRRQAENQLRQEASRAG